jgi:hypothetical protein
MSDLNQEDETNRRRKAWAESLLVEMERISGYLPPFGAMDEKTPSWVQAVEKQFALVMLPAAKLKKGQDITPKRLGAVVGHQCAIAVWMMEWFNAEEKQKELEKIKVDKPVEDDSTAQYDFEKWYLGMVRLAKKALCSSVNQTYDDMSDFLIGYAEGFRRKPRTLQIGDIGNTTFEIYVFMLMYWQLIETFSSVAHFHLVLVKMFGVQRVGDLKRVEKICERVGLTFREPGRPRTKKLK